MSADRFRARVYVTGGTFPPWLLLFLAPAVLVLFFFSFALLAAGGLIATLLLPLLWRRKAVPRDPSVIELEPSDYRKIGTARDPRREGGER